MRRRLVQGLFAAVVSIALTIGMSGLANAECEWSEHDPIFNIDGRIVRVIAYTPTTYINAELHYVLRISERSRATWSLPPGERLIGTVTIERDLESGPDKARITVTSPGRNAFRMKLSVSGAGLDGPAFETLGTSKNTQAQIRLVGR